MSISLSASLSWTNVSNNSHSLEMLNNDIFIGSSMTPFIMLMRASSKYAYYEGPFTKSMYRRLLTFCSCSIEGIRT